MNHKTAHLFSFDSFKTCEDMAIGLLGCSLVRRERESDEVVGKIVETEAYLGVGLDKASHSFRGKTLRNEAMFLPSGTAYVYRIYGMYVCMNISAPEEGAAVLLRSLRPITGLEKMRERRLKNRKKRKTDTESKIASKRKCGVAATLSSLNNTTNSDLKEILIKDIDLCNGPSKLCQALNIGMDLNKSRLSPENSLYLQHADASRDNSDCSDNGEASKYFKKADSGGTVEKVVRCQRIGLGASVGEEAIKKKLRFYRLSDASYVSVRDKLAEAEVLD